MSSPTSRPAEAAEQSGDSGGVLGPAHRRLTLGLAALVTVVAFVWLGVTTVMPSIAGQLHGLELYGWAFTGFMLANMIAAATVGQWADRAGPLKPFLVSLGLFVLGCAVAGAATNWTVFLLGRSAQGFGVGGVLTIVYLTVGLRYPDRLRARMLALVASCWTIPALAGPVLLGALADTVGWRPVFVVFVPLVLLAAIPAVPDLRGPGGGGAVNPRQVLATIALAIGVGVLLVGLEGRGTITLVVLVIAGVLIAIPALRFLMPPGYLTSRRGLASAVLSRGLVSAGYYGSEAFFPLALTTVFAFSTIEAGLGLAVGALTWVAGAWGQARFDTRHGNGGRRLRTIGGFGLLTLGLGLIALSLTTDATTGAVIAVLGWGVGGLGMGLVYPSVTTLALAQTPDENKGATSGSLQLSETLSVAIITGIAGSLISFGDNAGWADGTVLATVFALTGIAALVGIAVASRTLSAGSVGAEAK